MSIHCNCNSTSPRSTFLSLRIMSWTTFPSAQTMRLSSDRQLSRVGFTVVSIVLLGTPSSRIFTASRKCLMSNSASPILSSALNVSLSNTDCNHKYRKPLEIFRIFGASRGKHRKVMRLNSFRQRWKPQDICHRHCGSSSYRAHRINYPHKKNYLDWTSSILP